MFAEHLIELCELTQYMKTLLDFPSSASCRYGPEEVLIPLLECSSGTTAKEMNLCSYTLV